MEIIPPKFIVQYLVDNPAQNFKNYADPKMILEHNESHTKDYIIKLLQSLKIGTLEITQDEELALRVHIIKPRSVEFLFEERIGKWVDGSDYPYYVLVAVNETSSKSRNVAD